MKRKENALIKHRNLFKKYILTKLCLHWKYKTNLPFNINQCNSHQTEEENKINSIDRKKKSFAKINTFMVKNTWQLGMKGNILKLVKTTEDKMVGWHHRFNGHEFEQAPGVGNGQGSLACCSPCGRKESDTTELLN